MTHLSTWTVARVFFLAVLVVTIVSSAVMGSVAAQDGETTTTTPSPDDDFATGDSESSSSSNSGSGSDSSAESSDEDELSEYDFVFLNGVRLTEGNHTDGEARFTLHNPTDESKYVILNPSSGGEVGVRLDSGESRPMTVKMDGALNWELSFRTGISTATFDDEVGEDGVGSLDDLKYTITHDIIVIDHAPDIPHPIIAVFSGGVPIFVMVFGVIRKENRLTRIAVNINGPLRNKFNIESPQYEYGIDRNRHWMVQAISKQSQFVKQWLSAWILILIPVIIGVCGFLAIIGHHPLDSDLVSGVNTYMMYGELLFAVPSTATGVWVARKDWVELDQIRTDDGGFWLWYLTPSRYANMDVYIDISEISEEAYDELTSLIDKYTISDDGEKLYVPHSALQPAHSDSPREAYEVDRYHPYRNESKISFVNKELGVRTSELIRNDEDLRKVVKKDLHVRAQLGTLRKLNEGQIIRNRLEKAVNHIVHAFQRGVIPDEEEIMDEVSADAEDRVDDTVDKQLQRKVENGEIDGDNLPDRYSHLNGGDR